VTGLYLCFPRVLYENTEITLNALNTYLSVKLLLGFASRVIPSFSLLEINNQEFYSLLDMYVLRNEALFGEGGVSLSMLALHLF
jgi:hypothetical protein